MTNKHLIILLSPNIVWAAVVICTFITAREIRGFHRSGQQSETRQKFNEFVENIENGKWQLTQDQMLEGMRRARRIVEGERSINSSAGEELQALAWMTVVGIVWQAAALLTVRNASNKEMPTAPT